MTTLTPLREALATALREVMVRGDGRHLEAIGQYPRLADAILANPSMSPFAERAEHEAVDGRCIRRVRGRVMRCDIHGAVENCPEPYRYGEVTR